MLDLERYIRLKQLDVSGRRVLLRIDLDGPRSPQGAVYDDGASRSVLPTLRYLMSERCKVVLATRLTTNGKEEGRAAIHGLSDRLAELLGVPVRPLGRYFEREVRELAEGQVALAPDLSGTPEDAEGRMGWAAAVASNIDVYVLDGLGAARESDASVVELPRLMPSRGVGKSLDVALGIYHDAISAPAPEPYTFVFGGGRLRELAPLARSVFDICHEVVLGGSVANTFFVAQGWTPGASPFEPDAIDVAKELLARARARGIPVHLPIDAVVRTNRAGAAPSLDDRHLDRGLQPHEAVADIGPETCMAYRNVLARSTTVLWVGLMGDCSTPQTQRGSLRVGIAAAEAGRPFGAGRDVVEAVRAFRLEKGVRLAPGGDAMLSLLADAPLPGLEAVRR